MRLQLALNVTDLDEAVDFYSKMFATAPYKVKPGYANWEIENPPLKLVVFERPDAEPGSINHLGVETESADEVVAAEARVVERRARDLGHRRDDLLLRREGGDVGAGAGGPPLGVVREAGRSRDTARERDRQRRRSLRLRPRGVLLSRTPTDGAGGVAVPRARPRVRRG